MRRSLLFGVLASAGLGLLVRWVLPYAQSTQELTEVVTSPSPTARVLAASDSIGPVLAVGDDGALVVTIDSSSLVVHSSATLDIQGRLRTSGSIGDAGQVLTSGGDTQPPIWKTLTDLITGNSSSTSTNTTTSPTTDLTQPATSGHLLIADGDSWESVALGGDAGLTSAGTLTINPNAVALTTDTTGNYVATIADAGSSTITVTSGTGEGSAVTLDVIGVTCTDCLGVDQIKDVYILNSGDELTGALTFRSQNEARFADSDSSNYVGFKAPSAITTDRIWTLPSADGTSGQLLATNGSGVLSWTSESGVAADSLDFDDFEDALDLDAATTITNALSGNFVINLSSTGDFIIQDNGTAFATFSDAGAVTFANDLTVTGDVTISGDDLFLATNTSGAILVADGTNFNPVALSSDATVSSTGALTIAANAVALSTDTTGNYVATVADAGSGLLTVSGSGSEGAAVTLTLAADQVNFTELSDSLSLDAATTVTNGLSGNLTLNLSSTGDFVIQDAGVTYATFADDSSLTFTGVFDAGGATSLEVPNGSGPTVDATGELAVDTTGDDLIFYGGSAKRNLTYKQTKTVTLETPADADNFLIFKAPYAFTISAITCIVDPADSSESVVIDVQERDSSGDSPASVDTTITCSNTGAADDGSLSNPTIDSNDWVALDIGTVTGTVTQVSVTITYSKDAE